MSPSFNSFGSNPSVSQLVWDTDLVIPAGKAIESASGELGIVGDVSISGNLATDGAFTASNSITSLGGNLIGVNAVLSNKQLVFGEIVGNASVTLTQIPSNYGRSYTSPDFPITDSVEGVLYVVPPITHEVDEGSKETTFYIQAKLTDGSYLNLSSISLSAYGPTTGSTQATPTPTGTTALRYYITAKGSSDIDRITSNLTLSLTPITVY